MTNSHYDPELKYKLPVPVSNNSSDIVLNHRFINWEEHIEKTLKSFDFDDNYFYNKSSDSRSLLTACLEHIEEYQKIYDTENVIFLTHPLYLYLTNMNQLNAKTKKDVSEYTTNLFSFLKLCKDSEEVAVVLLETLYHYAATTSLFLEDGLVDRVIMTKHMCGSLLNPNEFKEFNERFIFFGGAYNDYCLTSSFQQAMEKIPAKQIFAIQDLILNPPNSLKTTLKPSSISVGSCKFLNQERVLTLDQTIERLGL